MVSCQSKPKNSSAQQEKVTSSSLLLSPNEFETLRDQLLSEGKPFTFIDVRTPEEMVKDGFIKGAENINFSASNFDERLAEIPKDQPILLYCKSGGRSSLTVEKLKALNCTQIYDLDRGINAWKKSGKPTQ